MHKIFHLYDMKDRLVDLDVDFDVFDTGELHIYEISMYDKSVKQNVEVYSDVERKLKREYREFMEV